MDDEWCAYQLEQEVLAPLHGVFAPVAEVVAFDPSGRAQPGSGFLIHPHVVVTAAHVVVFDSDPTPAVAKWVSVTVGNARHWARKVTIRRGYFGPNWSAFDVAMLLLGDQACLPTQTCALLDTAHAAITGTVNGFIDGLFRQVNVAVQQVGNFLEYTVHDLGGCSGGPVVVGEVDGQLVVAGVHRFHDHTQNVGRALSLVLADIAAPFASLGLFPPE